MEIDTPIAEDIHATDQRAQYDAACKRVLSQKIILAWILKSCLKEYQNCDVKEIAEKYIEGTPQVGEVPVALDATNAPRIRGMGSQDTSLTEGSSVYDIRFRALTPDTGEPVQMIIDLEAHNKFKPGYPLIKRGIFYCGRLLSAQDKTEFVHSEYQKIKKVVSIWVCMNPTKEYRNTITRYHLVEENLVGHVKEPLKNYDLIDVVMICLGGEGRENYEGVLKLLDVLLSSEVGEAKKRQVLEEEFNIPMTETLESEVLQMCNLSEGVVEKTMLASIKNLMETVGFTIEQAMDALRVSSDDRSRYTELLQKQ